jgi:EAL domain-containing protein (putative c-di-GMP-specific phosphodiesterase class I)
LSSLRDLPVDLVTVEKSFVDRVALDAEGAEALQGYLFAPDGFICVVSEGGLEPPRP